MFRASGNGNYAYTVARVKAKKSKILKAEDYNKLLAMSVPEISRYISEAGYSREMTDLADQYSGITLLEYATYGNMASAFRSILSASKGDCKAVVAAYLKEWDYMNVLTIVRGKRSDLSAEDIRSDLVPAGALKSDDLEKLIQLNTAEDVIMTGADMMHVVVPDDAMAAYKAENILAPLEDHFVKQYYHDLLKTVSSNDRPTTVFRSYVRSVVDTKNIETLLKLKSQNVDAETIMQYYVKGGKEVDEKAMAQFAAAADMPALFTELQQLKMFADIKDRISPESSIPQIVNALTHYLADLASAVSAMYPLSVLPVVDYMLHKRTEVSNIRLIAYGANTGLGSETVKELLVI